MYQEVKACRFCGSTSLESVLDLGSLCVSDFIVPGGDECKAPLELLLCCSCGLVQLRHSVDRDKLYRSYFYKSGTNESMVASLTEIATDACKRVTLEPYDTVVDIGCNDGTLLERFLPRALYERGYGSKKPRKESQYSVPLIRIGFEPCVELAKEAEAKDNITYVNNGYFPPDPQLLKDMPIGPKIISSIAMFYDLDDPNSFVAAIKKILHEDGIWVVQFQGLQDMLLRTAFDNICHEHLLYIDDAPFEKLINSHGLEFKDVSTNMTNGGSTRYIIGHAKGKPQQWMEPFDLIDTKERLSQFSNKVTILKDKTLNLLHDIQDNGETILGVAASTKANTYLQHFGIGPELLPAIGDRNPDKHGKLTVGTHIPIVSEEEMIARKPDYLLALAWHFLDSFRNRYEQFEYRGGRWIIGLPELAIIEYARPELAIRGKKAHA